MRPQTSRRFELRREMHARESSRRGNIGEAHGFAEAGFDILDRSLESPFGELGDFRSLAEIRSAKAQEPGDDGDADAIGVELPVRAADPFSGQKCPRESLDRWISSKRSLGAERLCFMARDVTTNLGNQSGRYVEVKNIVGSAEDAARRGCGLRDVERAGRGNAIVHRPTGDREQHIFVPQYDGHDVAVRGGFGTYLSLPMLE